MYPVAGGMTELNWFWSNEPVQRGDNSEFHFQNQISYMTFTEISSIQLEF